MKQIAKIILITIIAAAALYHQPVPALSQTKSELQQELDAVEELISQFEKELAGTRAEKQTLSNKINQLKKEQTKIQLQIRSTNLRVTELETNINDAESSIKVAGAKIENLKQKTADLLGYVYQNDQTSSVELLLMADSLTDAIHQLVGVESVSEEIIERSKEMQVAKVDLQQKQELMEKQQEEARALLSLQSLQEGEFKAKVSEQNEILQETKGTEAQYQAMLAESKRHASQIRVRLYELAGGSSSSSQVTFGQAVEIAKMASESTGVRAAFLLAILTQESNLGKNVGTCNRPGDPVEKSYVNIMHPTRDIPPFLEIAKELNLDPETTPVSCPMYRSGKRIGYGGAMGPAQFIPSTWQGYKGKVAAITGKPANPWDIKDAFLAAAVLLSANGASRDGRLGEWNAAMRYFSGSTNPQYRFYGDNVLALTDRYQAELDALAAQ